jgi:hypothetical protein
VVGVKLREASGLFVEYEIAHGQLELLEAGGQKPHNSWWAYRSARTAAAAQRSLAGHPAVDVVEPAELAAVLDATARVQAVKCSAKDGVHSARIAEMSNNCPPRYLRRELAILESAVVVAFGMRSGNAIELIGEIHETVGGASFSRSKVIVDELSFSMVWLRHPAAPGSLWEESFELLLRNLREDPLRSPPAARTSQLRQVCVGRPAPCIQAR